MKTAFLALFFFLFAFARAATVLDTDGKPVRNSGGQYYVLPVLRGKGGGLGLARVGRETCPRTVVQASSELSNGLPVTFSSPLRIGIISTGMYLDIEFEEVPTCTPKPSLWHISEDSQLEGSVKVGGERFHRKFKIEQESEDGYKLMYCSRSSDSCRDLGIAIDENNKRCLVVKDGNPLIVKFENASKSSEEWSIV